MRVGARAGVDKGIVRTGWYAYDRFQARSSSVQPVCLCILGADGLLGVWKTNDPYTIRRRFLRNGFA